MYIHLHAVSMTFLDPLWVIGGPWSLIYTYPPDNPPKNGTQIIG